MDEYLTMFYNGGLREIACMQRKYETSAHRLKREGFDSLHISNLQCHAHDNNKVLGVNRGLINFLSLLKGVEELIS